MLVVLLSLDFKYLRGCETLFWNPPNLEPQAQLNNHILHVTLARDVTDLSLFCHYKMGKENLNDTLELKL